MPRQPASSYIVHSRGKRFCCFLITRVTVVRKVLCCMAQKNSHGAGCRRISRKRRIIFYSRGAELLWCMYWCLKDVDQRLCTASHTWISTKGCLVKDGGHLVAVEIPKSTICTSSPELPQVALRRLLVTCPNPLEISPYKKPQRCKSGQHQDDLEDSKGYHLDERGQDIILKALPGAS